MKYAIIADIHGNLPALELAMEDARQHGADHFLFAGDYCTRAPWFNGVVQLLRSTPGARIIRGNEEHHLHLPDQGDGQFSISYWTGKHIQPEHRAWLDALPSNLTFTDGDIAIHMAHSSEAFIGKAEMQFFPPWRLLVRYPDGVTRQTLLDDIRRHLLSFPGCMEQIHRLPAGVYIFGHTHCQWHAALGEHVFINPGSCGIPLDRTGTGAAYTLLTVDGGRISVEERRVPYDAEALIARFRQTEQYEAVRVWSELIFDEWRTGTDQIIRFLWYAEHYARSIGDGRRPFAHDTWEAAYAAWQRDGKPLIKPEE